MLRDCVNAAIFIFIQIPFLCFLPGAQITVDDAMAHPYFDSVRSQYTDPDPVLPLGPGA